MTDAFSSLRMFAPAAAFIALAFFESIWPALPQTRDLATRWVCNFGLYVVNTGVAFLLAAIGVSASNAGLMAHSSGLFARVSENRPGWLVLLAALVALDLFNYAGHWLMHRLTPLWWLHGIHHADAELDATTGFRHHPGETIAVALLGLVFGFAVGIPPLYWGFYAVLANVVALTSHANLRLPEALDRALRVLLVTPGMHRHHHAVDRAIHDTNYGIVLSVWDRLFGTYHSSGVAERDAQQVGLPGMDGPAEQRLDGALLMPFRLARGQPG
jgi:sterol desaturase/sphingolipid hydroxylase (fatty acid hydroxylase superfamily)